MIIIIVIQTPMGQKKVSIIISEVSLFQGLSNNCSWGKKCVHISEVSSFQGLNCTQELFSGKKMSLLERCPHFRSVLKRRVPVCIFRFHYIQT